MAAFAKAVLQPKGISLTTLRHMVMHQKLDPDNVDPRKYKTPLTIACMDDRKDLIEMFLKVGADLFYVNWWQSVGDETESDNIAESPVLALYERKDRIQLNSVLPAYLEGQLFKSILFRREMKDWISNDSKLVTDYLFFNQETFSMGPIIHSYGNMLKQLTPKPKETRLSKRKLQYKALSKVLHQLKSVATVKGYGGQEEWFSLLSEKLLPPIQHYDPTSNTECPLLLNKQLRIMERLSVIDKGLEGDFKKMTVKALVNGGLQPILQLSMQLCPSMNTVNHESQTDLLCLLETISYATQDQKIKELLTETKDFVKTIVKTIALVWKTHVKKNIDIKTGIIVWSMMILNDIATFIPIQDDLFPFLTMCVDEANHGNRWKKLQKDDADKIQMLAISIAESTARKAQPQFFTGFTIQGETKHRFMQFISESFFNNNHPDSFIVGVLGFFTDLCAENDPKVIDAFLQIPRNPCLWIVSRLFRFNDKVNFYSLQLVCNILAGSDDQFEWMMKMRANWINDAIRFFSSMDPKGKTQELFATLRIIYIVSSARKSFSKEHLDQMRKNHFLPKLLFLLRKEEKTLNPVNVDEVFYWIGLLQSMNIKDFQPILKEFMTFFQPFQKRIDKFMGFDAFHECLLISLID